MEEEKMEAAPQEEQGYKPRPGWQVWLARVGLAAFIVFLILYYLVIFRGGI